jgi:hypothetical protein
MVRTSFLLMVIITGLSLVGCNVRESASVDTIQNNPDEHAEIIPDIIVPQLPVQLHESSGLIIFRDLLWTMNDSGGEAALYGFDLITGDVKQVVRIENAENVDWESLTSDGERIFIGDFGNNRGNRNDLRVFIIEKSDIPEEENVMLTADTIGFTYPDQVNFSYGMNNNPFDCEAFICFSDTLFLFSKDWVSRNTKVYAIPSIPGNYVAEIVDSFLVDGLVTGADISRTKQRLALLGYKDYIPFIWYFDGIDKSHLLSGNKTKFMMTEFFRAQTEGIAFSGEDTLYVSSEHSQLPSRLYRVVLDK